MPSSAIAGTTTQSPSGRRCSAGARSSGLRTAGRLASGWTRCVSTRTTSLRSSVPYPSTSRAARRSSRCRGRPTSRGSGAWWSSMSSFKCRRFPSASSSVPSRRSRLRRGSSFETEPLRKCRAAQTARRVTRRLPRPPGARTAGRPLPCRPVPAPAPQPQWRPPSCRRPRACATPPLVLKLSTCAARRPRTLRTRSACSPPSKRRARATTPSIGGFARW
mmetsp:Transcript_28478/g.83588  ORF Transcript_28478/g.83588 Transcript_28478/m.83588 type:complete len:219 (+) Transcript_28478:426-1082(+)